MLLSNSDWCHALAYLSCVVAGGGVTAVGSALFLKRLEEAELLTTWACVSDVGAVASIENKKMLCKLHNVWTTKLVFSLVALWKKIWLKKWQWAKYNA